MSVRDDLPGVPEQSRMVSEARDLARRLLQGDAERSRHSAGVAGRAASLTASVAGSEAGLLVAAAWLHDIGYAANLQGTGFIPSGARFLRAAGWDPILCNLVAHHSGSRFLARVQGLEKELAEFTYDEGPVSDALTVADQTVGPNGSPLSLEERMREMLERHGPDSANARAHPQRAAYVRSASSRVSERLRTARLTAEETLSISLPGEGNARDRRGIRSRSLGPARLHEDSPLEDREPMKTQAPLIGQTVHPMGDLHRPPAVAPLARATSQALRGICLDTNCRGIQSGSGHRASQLLHSADETRCVSSGSIIDAVGR